MKPAKSYLLVLAMAVLSALQPDTSLAAEVTEIIGFGQSFDSALEGESKNFRVLLEPNPIEEVIHGRIVPLTISQYRNYSFTTLTSRTVPEVVEVTINASHVDPADYDSEANRTDFDNAVINITINGTTTFIYDVRNVINVDDMNEAEEVFILVLEIDNEDIDFAFDEEGGVLVYTILDDNPIFLNFVMPSIPLHFIESHGSITNVLSVEKQDKSLQTEVDIPFQIVIGEPDMTAAVNGEDFTTTTLTYTILTNEFELSLYPIHIINDSIPETIETFTLSLENGPGPDTLNVFPTEEMVEITIRDDDVAQIRFTEERYSVTEGEEEYVEVCIEITDGVSRVSLNSSFGMATLNISTSNASAESGADYNATAEPNTLTLEAGQDVACSTILIFNDTFVEADEVFNVTVMNYSDTFYAGVDIIQETATIEIMDNDRAIVGFNMSNYASSEGEHVSVCVEILFPDTAIVRDSDIYGEFNISTSSDDIMIFPATLFVLNSTNQRECVDVTLVSDGQVEGPEEVVLSLEENIVVRSFGVDSLQPNTTTISVEDEDFAEIGFNETIKTITEGSGGVTTTICVEVISGTIAPDVTVSYSLMVPSNLPDVSFGSTMGRLTADNLTYCHDVTLTDDDVVEPDRTFDVEINQSSLWPTNTIITYGIITITIINDDELVIFLESEETQIDEGSAIGIIVRFEGQLAQGISISVNLEALTMDNADDDDFILNAPSFTLADGNQIENITLTAIDDNFLEDVEESFTLSLTIDNQDIKYRISGSSSLDITINDNEDLVFKFEESVYKVPETQLPQFVWVAYNHEDVQFPSDLSIFASVNAEIETSSNATQGDDYIVVQIEMLIFNSNTADGRVDIQLSIVDDDLVEGPEVINLRLTEPIIITGLMNTASVDVTGRRTVVIINDDDRYTVGFNRTNTSGEEGESVEVCIENIAGTLAPNITLAFLIHAPREDPLLPPESQPDSAEVIASTGTCNDGDYITTQERVHLSASTTGACVMIHLCDDEIVEINEVFLVQVAQVRSSDDLLLGFDPEYTDITIIDNDEIMMGFEMSEYRFSESAGIIAHEVLIVRENPVTVSTTFTVTVILLPESTASIGDDFTLPNGVMVTFGGDDANQNFVLEILPDFIAEGNETIVLEITTEFEGDLSVVPGRINRTTIIIEEDDFIRYRYVQPEYSFNETDTSTEICVTIENGTFTFVQGGYLTLSFSTSPLSANETEDYERYDVPSITLSDDNRTECTKVTITPDLLVEGRETFQVIAEADEFNGSYAVNGSDTVTVAILDNSIADVGFNQTVYTVSEGEEGEATSVSVCVAVIMSDTFVLTDAVYLNYSLSSQPNTASMNEDYFPTILPDTGILTSSNSIMCHSMIVRDDDQVEPPETFTVSINATGPSQEFIDLFNITVPETAVRIVDNDSVTVEFSDSKYTFREDAGLVYDVCLMFYGPLKMDSYVELNITLIPDDGADDSDYSLVWPATNVLTLNFTRRMDCILINITDDNIVEGTETFTVHFDETHGNMIMIAEEGSASVTITDNEVVQLEFGSSTYTFSEDTSVDNAVIDIVISNYAQLDINHDVSVLVISHGAETNTTLDDLMIQHSSNNQAVIAVGNNSTSVLLNINNDTLIEGVELAILMMTLQNIVGVVDGDNHVNVTNKRTEVYIEDDDVATIGFSRPNYTSAEGNVSVCVVLDRGDKLGDGVTIRYTVNTTSDESVAGDFARLNEDIGQITNSLREYCHNINITDDKLVESIEEFQVDLLSVFNVANVIFNPDTATVFIEDSDTVLVGFEKGAYSSGENEGLVTIAIIRQDNLTPVHPFSVDLRLGIPTNATEGTDFTIVDGRRQTIEFGINEMFHNLTVSITNDNVGEGDEIITLELVTSLEVNTISVGSNQDTTVITIIEDDMIEVAFDAPRYTVSEGETTSEVCVEILPQPKSIQVDLPPGGTVDVVMTATNVTATVEEDYSLTPDPMIGTLNEVTNMTCFTITTPEDIKVEGAEEIEVQFSFMNRIGSFIARSGDDSATIIISDDDFFEVGFERSFYEVGEEIVGIVDEVYIVKMDENTLQREYNFIIHVIHDNSQSPFPAVLDEDFHMNNLPIPLRVTFEPTNTRIPIPFSLLNDEHEEGYENFTLRLVYEDQDDDETVQIVTESAIVSIRDDDVVVIGFEAEAYIVFEGQTTEVCVAVLERTLTNPDEPQRQFTVVTSEATENTADGNGDYDRIQGDDGPGSISLDKMRQCFEVETLDDESMEEPEKFLLRVDERDHLIEFAPDFTIIWIIDDDSLLLPVPAISTLNCTTLEIANILTVTCSPPPGAAEVASLLCSVDGEPLKPCSELLTETSQRKRAAELQFILNLLEFDNSQHVLEVVGLTRVTELLRDAVLFYGADGVPEPQTIWQDREFVAAVAIAGVAFIILLLLILAICLLIFYHRKVNRLNKYGLDLRSENQYVGIDRNLSYRDHDRDPVVELVDYSVPPDARPPLRRTASPQSHTSSSTSGARPQSQLSRERPLSEASTVGVASQEPAIAHRTRSPTATATTFHIPPPPPAAPKAAAAMPVVPAYNMGASGEEQHDTLEPKSSLDEPPDLDTEEQLLIGEDGRGLRITRRHSVEAGKESRKQQVRSEEAAKSTGGSLSHKVDGGKKSAAAGGAYSVTYAKELRGKEWEAEMQREFEEEIAKEKESVRARERRREQEQRQRRREREQASRDLRAQERVEREREREAAKERRLQAQDHPEQQKPGFVETDGPESFL